MERQTLDYQRDEHRIHLCAYHLAWTPKRKKAVLKGDVALRCHNIIQEKCEERGWQILKLTIKPDRVHLWLRTFPSDAPGEVIRQLKGITAHHLRQEFPDLLKLPSLWTKAYFCSTARSVPPEIIEKYITAQNKL
jgi:putative transposase